MALGLAERQNNPEITVNQMVLDWSSISVAGSGSRTLSTSEANNAQLSFTGVLTGNKTVYVPAEAKVYPVYNNTSGAFSLTVKATGGTGVVVAQGRRALLGCDGTDVGRYAADAFDSLIDGELVHDMTANADYTLDTTTEEWRNETIEITDTGVLLTAGRSIICPVNRKKYIVLNSTAQILTFKVAAQTGVAVGVGKTAIVRCDGTDVVRVSADV